MKISVSALLSGAIGAEREWTGKWAGLRTHMLIAVGSTLLTHISTHATDSGGTWDNGRIAAQIVTGVGFLGAGTILQSRGAVHGLTTAAGLWVAAAIGIAVGAGSYVAAMLTTVALLIILTLLRPLEDHLLRNHIRIVVLQLERGQKISQVMEVVEDCAIETAGIDISRGPHPAVTIKVRGAESEALRLIQTAALHGLRAVEETPSAHPVFHGGPPPAS